MSRVLGRIICVAVVLGLFTAGHWFGAYRTSRNIASMYVIDKMQRELAEARHDAGLVRILASQRHDSAFEVAQQRYYSRILLIAELALNSHSPGLDDITQEAIAQAKVLWNEHPYPFQSEREKESWARLSKSH